MPRKVFKKTEEIFSDFGTAGGHGYIWLEEPERQSVGRPADVKIIRTPQHETGIFCIYCISCTEIYTGIAPPSPSKKSRRFGDGWFGRIRWIFPNRGRQDCLQKQGCRTHLTCCVDSTRKSGRLPQEPHPPRRAHDTLQPQDESVIVGYYTSAGSAPRPRRPYKRERSSMARNDGIDRTSARNVNLTAAKIGNAQRHNEREKESYTNPDIIPERTPQNIHFKKPTAGYAEMFARWKRMVYLHPWSGNQTPTSTGN